MKTQNNIEKKIVSFHLGRGGRFNNPGHRSFIGEHDLQTLISWACERNAVIENRDKKGRFCKPFLKCCSSGSVICATVNDETGVINWDGDFDTVYACHLENCNENELEIIMKSCKSSDELKKYCAEKLKFEDDFDN